MKEFAEEIKKRTDHKSEQYIIKEENLIKSSLHTLHAELKRMNQKRSTLRDEIKEEKKKCSLSIESLDSVNLAIQKDEDQLEKDQGQLQVYQKQIDKEQQEKELIQQKRLESEKELKSKYSALREINQQIKSQREKRFELEKYSAILRFWRYWSQIEGNEQIFLQNLGVEMLNEEANSEDESEAECQSPKRSR